MCIPRSSALIDERGAAESQNARRMLGTLSQLVADLDGGPRSGRLELERPYPSCVSQMTVGPDPGRDPFGAGAVASPRRPVVYRDLRGRRKIEFSTTLSLDFLAVSGVLGRGGRAKAGPLEVPFTAKPRRGKGVKTETDIRSRIHEPTYK